MFNVYDFCGMLHYSYQTFFHCGGYIAALKISGTCPIDAKKLLSEPRPQSKSDPNTLMTVEQLLILIEQKREDLKESVIGSGAIMPRNGYLDTIKGMVITADKVSALIRHRHW